MKGKIMTEMNKEKWDKVLDSCLEMEDCDKCGEPLVDDELQYCKRCWSEVRKEVIDDAFKQGLGDELMECTD